MEEIIYMHHRFCGKYVAMAAAVSCLMGTAPFTVYGKETEAKKDQVNISWWICPAGDWCDDAKVQELVDGFEKEHPDIAVSFRIFDEDSGEHEIAEALGAAEAADDQDQRAARDSADDQNMEDAQAPDVVLGAPEYLVTEWGNDGLMVELDDLWDEDIISEFRPEMTDAAISREGVWYAVPLYRDLYTMAVNYDMFEEAGVLQYMNEEVHTWKDSGFIDSVLRIHDTQVQKGDEKGVVGKVYCKDQNGQRAFMCFVENFFKTGLIDDYRSAYQLGKGGIRNTFITLRKLFGKGIEFDPDMDGDAENEAFINGDLFMTFNWSASKQRKAEGQTNFRVFPMMYPNSKNVPTLTGPIGALGAVKSGDKEKEEAAVSFIRYMMTDEEAYTDAVLMSGCFPARRRIGGHELNNMYGSDEVMRLYEVFNDYYEEYAPTMELYSELDAAWPGMLRQIAQGAKIKDVLNDLNEKLNGELLDKYDIHPIQIDEEE